MKLGTEIAKLRQQQDMTQEQLAERLGVSRQAVTKWEASEAVPELRKVVAIADLFGVSLDKLFGREDRLYDLVKVRVEELSASCRKEYDGEDILPFISRFIKYSESLGLSSEQITNGIMYLCDDEA